MSSCVGRNVQFCCERYRLHLFDVLRTFSFEDMLSVSRPIDDMSLSYADVVQVKFNNQLCGQSGRIAS